MEFVSENLVSLVIIAGCVIGLVWVFRPGRTTNNHQVVRGASRTVVGGRRNVARFSDIHRVVVLLQGDLFWRQSEGMEPYQVAITAERTVDIDNRRGTLHINSDGWVIVDHGGGVARSGTVGGNVYD